MNSVKRLLLAALLLSTSASSFANSEIESYEGLSVDQIMELEISESMEEMGEEGLLEEETSEEGSFEKRRWWPIRRVVCVAKNRRGRRFTGWAKRRHQAKRRALRNCRSSSRRGRSCHVVRCSR
jgi:hypothetical protein